MPELPRVDDPEEAAFQRRYGPWRAWTPSQAATVLAGWTEPWWVGRLHPDHRWLTRLT